MGWRAREASEINDIGLIRSFRKTLYIYEKFELYRREIDRYLGLFMFLGGRKSRELGDTYIRYIYL